MKNRFMQTVAAVLVCTLVLGSGLTVMASPLPDTVGHWAEAEIRHLVGLRAISGYPDGTYRPEQTITRAEFSSVVFGALDLEEVEGNTFSDTQGHWGQGRIEALIQEGIIDTGIYGDQYGPDDPITREEIAMMTTLMLTVPGESQGIPFIDTGEIGAGFLVYVARAYQAGIIRGYPDNTFRPGGLATRAEAAVMVLRTLVVDRITDRAEGTTSDSGECTFYVSVRDREEVMVRIIAEDDQTGQPLEDIDVELVVTDSTLELFLHDPKGAHLPEVLIFDLDMLDEYPEVETGNSITITVGLLALAVKTYSISKFVAGGIAIMKGTSGVLTVKGVVTSFAVSLVGETLYTVFQHMEKDEQIAYPTTFYVFEAVDSDHATEVKVPAGATGEEIDRAIRDITGDIDVDITIPTESPAGAYYHPDGSPKIYNVYPTVESYTVTVTANPQKGGTVVGGGTFRHGETVTVTATPNEGYFWLGWTEDGQPVDMDDPFETSYTFTVAADRTLVAGFTLFVGVEARPGDYGTVTMQVEDFGAMNLGKSGGQMAWEGARVTVTATPEPGYEFVNWTEDDIEVSTSISYQFTVTTSHNLVANFR